MRGSGIILLNSNNQILLLLRDDKIEIPFPNMWDIPGGRVEGNETPEDAVRREINEEFGITDLGEINLFKIIISDDLIDHIYWKRIDLNPDEINLTEGQKIEYFDLERIREMILAFNYNKVVEDFYNEIVYPK